MISRRISRAISALLATLLLLSGCATLPQAGDPVLGPDIQFGKATDFLYYSPLPPSEDASQEEIVNGFINAGTGPQNDYSVAREYLTDDFKATWNPSEEVIIQERRVSLSFLTGNRAELKVIPQATIDKNGIFQLAESGSERNLDFQLVRENGQWRIASAPNATVLIPPVFDVIFRSYSLYFYDRSFDNLVPDLRWFPTRASIGTRIMTALLDGPVDWLKSGVVSAIPSGTRLSINAVRIEAGVASVDLTARALNANTRQRQLLKSQIRATLTQLTSVSSVNIFIERSPQDIIDAPIPTRTRTTFNPFALTEEALYRVSNTTAAKLQSSEAIVAELKPTKFAVSQDESLVAFSTERGVELANLGGVAAEPRLVDTRTGLLTPHFDSFGYLWSIGTSPAASLLAIRNANESEIASAQNWLSGVFRRDFAISPEGSRIIFSVESANQTQIAVAVIRRDESGLPIEIGPPRFLQQVEGDVVDITWGDETTVAALTRQVGQDPAPYLITLGGEQVRFAGLADAVELAVANPNTQVYARTGSGGVYHYRGVSWNLAFENARALHFVN